MDGRYTIESKDKMVLKLEGLFINIRSIFSDYKGDRIIIVGQLDIENNLKIIKPYQAFFQYKGPLGKWNIRVGHYILPFGLLSNYDTERLILKTMEDLNLGIKLDTGIELLGFLGSFDYAVSVSQGVGQNRLTDIDNDKLITARIGWQDEDINLGLSGFIGEVLTEKDSIIRKEIGSESLYEKRLGLDLTKYIGQLTLRGELNIGKDKNDSVGGILLEADYSLIQKLELNFKYAYWQRKGSRNFIGIGFSYELLRGLFIRFANEYQFGKENKNEFILQIYYDFSKNF
ncbi:MAG: hypothetical protein QXZ43_04820 [Candidatus Aenigmatarchaeota archaeon]